MAKRAALPWVGPQLATLSEAAPAGDDWVHEIKYDGYRLLGYVTASGVRLLTRNEKDWSARFDEIAVELSGLGPVPLLIDGEVAVELETGVTSFQALQNAERSGTRSQLRYYVFDLLYEAGRDLRALPLVERKARLRAVLEGADLAHVRYSDHQVGLGPRFFERACRHGLEGIISKRASAPYRSGRGTDWLKVKCLREQEFVIGGYTDPAGSRQGFGALHVGEYDRSGDLVYRGKVGTGFTDAVLRDLWRRLRGLAREESPFTAGAIGAAGRGSHWVDPVLVAQVRFTEWTADGRMRHPAFMGLREDKDAREVRLERPVRNPREVAKSAAAPRRARTREEATEVAGVRLTSPSRVVYPAEGITKLELARYYAQVADVMMPHIAGRPLTVIRCPDDITECFFQKHVDRSRIYDAVERVPVREEKGVRFYPAVHDRAGLLSLVQLGVVEFHTLGARSDDVEKPDRLTLDLDPDPSVPWQRVVHAARVIRDLLEEIGLRSFVKTTGGKGLHVVVPLRRRSSWEEVRDFSRALASLLVQAAPDEYTIQVSKARRQGKILIDYLRNARGAVAVEAYSARARDGAPVSVPLRWDELGRLNATGLTIRTTPRRLASQRADPWEDYFRLRQSITAAMRRSVGM